MFSFPHRNLSGFSIITQGIRDIRTWLSFMENSRKTKLKQQSIILANNLTTSFEQVISPALRPRITDD